VRGEARQALDRLRLRGEVWQLRADVDVEPEDVETVLERLRDRGLRLLGREPELRAVMAGDDRLVRVRVHAERDPNEHLANPRGRSESDLVRRVEGHRR